MHPLAGPFDFNPFRPQELPEGGKHPGTVDPTDQKISVEEVLSRAKMMVQRRNWNIAKLISYFSMDEFSLFNG